MSQFASEYAQFFESPAGISLLTWLQDQRTTMHEKAENDPAQAAYHAMQAVAYRDILDHIDSVQIGIGKPRVAHPVEQLHEVSPT